ncbi:MAG TPA: DUF3617 domain-containing protein [Terracidiphilus sp.]|nr:DUF3617 domain-containing protein [Terracidiphilus sp.]
MKFGAKAVALCAAVAALGTMAWGQAGRKPGLYEVTTTMSWQQSPFPQGMQLPPQAAAAFGGGPRTTQMCLTQEMIDRYGAPMPQSRGECTIANISKTLDSMTAEMVCTGHFSGKGTIESHWSMDGTSKGKVHFVGSMQMGPNPTPIEWTAESTSVYKGPDCGDVKPLPMPKQQ